MLHHLVTTKQDNQQIMQIDVLIVHKEDFLEQKSTSLGEKEEDQQRLGTKKRTTPEIIESFKKMEKWK